MIDEDVNQQYYEGALFFCIILCLLIYTLGILLIVFGTEGDTFIVSEIKSHDRRIPIPAFSEYAKGNFTAHATPNLITVIKFMYRR